MTAEEIAFELAAPFPPNEIRFRPGAVKKDKTAALPLAYIDARSVLHRLDAVVGIANWRDRYTVLPGGCVECELSLRIDGEWIGKSDVGTPSDQHGGDEVKAAYSDALKRAAVRWGIGRFLYDMEMPWTPINANGFFSVQPQIPEWCSPEAYYRNRPKSLVSPTSEVKPTAIATVADDPLGRRMAEAIQKGGTKALVKLWEKEFTQDERKAFQGRLDGAKKAAAKRDPELMHEEAIADWTKWLSERPDLEAFNGMVPKIANVVPSAKQHVWHSVEQYAEGMGWSFDGQKKQFYPRSGG